MEMDSLRTYLNDHLAGATLGCDHARQLEANNEGTPFGEEMSKLAADIEADRDTLEGLMDRLEVSRNPVKQATAWVAEKAGKVKFTGISANDAELGNFLALETMSLGIEGKRSLWIALREVSDGHAELVPAELDELIARAETQRTAIETERRAAAQRAFGVPAAAAS
jgi:hypothetical protein